MVVFEEKSVVIRSKPARESGVNGIVIGKKKYRALKEIIERKYLFCLRIFPLYSRTKIRSTLLSNLKVQDTTDPNDLK